ncbi:hypothetical protein HCK00_12475 [Streptomyces sp. PLAI1-29]|uniref:Uncharacterized protein n=1 Tax=Streptomyces zingiberis TaxID=2053010 RepID=A0ABX1BUC5_9ACTN|nr:hypothetical protein [Streptomyces zingiberis]
MSLPGADELFRTTGGTALQASTPASQAPAAPAPARRNGDGDAPADGTPRVPAPAFPGEDEAAGPDRDTPPEHGGRGSGSPDDRPERSERPEGSDRPGAPAGTAPGGSPAAAAPSAPTVPPVPSVRRPAARQAQESPDRPAAAAPQGAPRRRGRAAARRPSGRERHDEKITVYVSAEELMDLEHARLVLRGEHGLAVDRGRIVREAVAVVLADLESRGDASILVRRLRGS